MPGAPTLRSVYVPGVKDYRGAAALGRVTPAVLPDAGGVLRSAAAAMAQQTGVE